MVRLNWDDPTKQLSRDLHRLDILDLFPDPTARTKLSVLHLPGASNLEYQRVFQPAGISPTGIVGLEKEPEAFRILEKKKRAGEIKYELVYGTLEEYLAKTTRKFDDISADTTEIFGPQQVDMIWNIFQRPAISDRAILHTVFLGAREQKINKAMYAAWFLSRQYNGDAEIRGGKKFTKQFGPDVKNFQRLVKSNASLQKIRDIGITHFITYSATLGQHISTEVENLISRVEMSERRSFMRDVEPWSKILGTDLVEKIFHNLLCTAYNVSMVDSLVKRGIPSEFIGYLMLKERRPWFVKKIQPYAYTSQTGPPLYGDLLELDRRNDLFENPRYRISAADFFSKRRGRKSFSPTNWQGMVDYGRKVLKEIRTTYSADIPPRIVLSL